MRASRIPINPNNHPKIKTKQQNPTCNPSATAAVASAAAILTMS
jgi:hypothetical protein